MSGSQTKHPTSITTYCFCLSEMALQPSFSGENGEKSENKRKENVQNEKKDELKCKHEFQSAWQSEFDGSAETDNGMICTVSEILQYCLEFVVSYR